MSVYIDVQRINQFINDNLCSEHPTQRGATKVYPVSRTTSKWPAEVIAPPNSRMKRPEPHQSNLTHNLGPKRPMNAKETDKGGFSTDYRDCLSC